MYLVCIWHVYGGVSGCKWGVFAVYLRCILVDIVWINVALKSIFVDLTLRCILRSLHGYVWIVFGAITAEFNVRWEASLPIPPTRGGSAHPWTPDVWPSYAPVLGLCTDLLENYISYRNLPNIYRNSIEHLSNIYRISLAIPRSASLSLDCTVRSQLKSYIG